MSSIISVLQKISAFLLAALTTVSLRLGIKNVDFSKLFPLLNDNREVVEIKDGQSYEISGNKLIVYLKANAGTGYEWKSEIKSGDCVKLVSSDVISQKTDVPITGGPITYCFTFETVKDGEATLEFTFARSWERTDSDKIATLNIEVTDGVITVK